MSANDRNEAFFDKNEAAADSTEGELSQDELDNVSGGRAMFKAEQPDGRLMGSKTDGQSSNDPLDRTSF